MAETGFASFARLLAANMRHAGALRIDHAMGLSRLFWIPEGGNGADGAYVSYPFADLIGQVALESMRARCLIVGEDLGTVPDGFHTVLSEADILSYRVLLLEREGRGFKPASSYPTRAVACVSTHDLPPLAGWLEGTDVRERAILGYVRDGPGAERERSAQREALAEQLVRERCLVRNADEVPPVAEMVTGAHAFVASTASDLMLVQAEDLAGMRVAVNLPGTDRERPNWRIRSNVAVETLLAGPTAQSILGTVREAGRATAREDGTLGNSKCADVPDGTAL
jgi:glycogen operon protein